MDEHRPYDLARKEGKKRLDSQIHYMPLIFESVHVVLPARARVLSIMAGSCVDAIAIASRYHAEVTCLDLQRKLLVVGAREAGRRKIKLRTIVADARELTRHVRGSFDLIAAFGSPLVHLSISDLDRVVQEVKKVLAKDGLFVIEQKDMIFGILPQYPGAMVKNLEPIVVSIHRKFNAGEGYFERLYYGKKSHGINRVYLWGPWIIDYVLRKNGFSKVETLPFADPFFMMQSYLTKAQI